MKKTQTIFCTLLFSILMQLSFAQYGAQKKGDYFFGQFSYIKAIGEYQKMIDGSFKTDYAHQQLAECYLLIRDFKKSIPHFKVIINNPNLPKDYFFKYAMALYSNGNKKEALSWLKKYKKFNKKDSRVKRFLEVDGNLASVVFNSRERYEIFTVPFNSKESDFGAFLHEGNLYFSSSRVNKDSGDNYGWNDEPWLDIYTVQEGNEHSVPGRLVGNVNTKYHESNLVYSTDYKNDTVVYFTRNNYYKKKEVYGVQNELNLKIFSAIKIDGEWTVNRNLSINSDHYSVGHPFVTPDRKRLYFTSDGPGSIGGSDIFYAEIHARGGIGKPINAGPVINTEGNEMFPYINEEGQLFFSSDGHVGLGQLDVYSTISNEEGKIVDVVNLGAPINSSSDDFGFYGTNEGLTGYVSSNREGGMGGDDIYAFKFTPSLAIEGYAIDGVNGQYLDNVLISLYDQKDGSKVGEVQTNEKGYYQMQVERKVSYVIEAARKTHPKKNEYFNTFGTHHTTKTQRQDIILNPVLDLKVLADLNKIYFDFNKSNIRPDAAVELNKVVKLMTKTYPEMVISLEAHTDPVGSNNYNDNLSEKRAKSTYDYLIANGVPKDHILSYKGYGKRKIINGCTGKKDCTPEELELNRRTEFPIDRIKKNVSRLAK
ncbi:MAG: OmpA family protein [Cellulophaga sp.]